jgi:hypothetical protein
MHQQRVAVRLGVGGELRADRARRARLGLDDDRLLQKRLQHRGEGPADHVGGAAGWKRIDQRHLARGIGVLREGG